MTPEELAALHARAIEVPRPWTRDEFAALLATPQVHIHEAGAAFALGRSLAGQAELLTLATDPAARRRGLARRALASFEAEAAQRGATEAFLEVAVNNAPALALYASAGWAHVGARRGYYTAPDGARIDAAVMHKSVAPV